MPESPDGFVKTTINLPASHAWKCKPGNSLFVADRGAVAFEIPASWVIRHDKKQTLSFHDQAPPADQARISLTVFHLPPVRGGWGKLPLDKLLAEVSQMRATKRKQKGPKPAAPPVIHREVRPELELAWADKAPWKDPQNGRLIHCRQLLARARLVQCLITFDVYAEVAAQFEPIWADLLATLQLAVPRDITGNVGN